MKIQQSSEAFAPARLATCPAQQRLPQGLLQRLAKHLEAVGCGVRGSRWITLTLEFGLLTNLGVCANQSLSYFSERLRIRGSTPNLLQLFMQLQPGQKYFFLLTPLLPPRWLQRYTIIWLLASTTELHFYCMIYRPVMRRPFSNKGFFQMNLHQFHRSYSSLQFFCLPFAMAVKQL